MSNKKVIGLSLIGLALWLYLKKKQEAEGGGGLGGGAQATIVNGNPSDRTVLRATITENVYL